MPMRDLPVVPGSSEYPPSRARARSLRGWDTRLVGTERATVVLRGGWQALAEADWERARVCFEQASELDESPEALDGLSQALHFQGEYDRAIGLKERAFAEYRRRGQWAEAADLARWLAFLQVCVHGNLAVGSGWMARAARLLDGAEECAAHGWLTLDRAPFSRDSAEREQLAKAAIAIAKRFDDTDLELDALALLGEAYVASGRVAEGMALLDEAMAAVLAGEVVSHGSVGMICCRLLSACEQTTDVKRAEQWMAVVDRLAAWSSFVSPTCRCHYGGILIATGPWPEAEAELLAAIRAFETGYQAERLYPLVRLADLRVKQGRFEEAERLLEGGEWHPTARRSLASIAFARGDLALAAERVALCLEREDDPACAPVLELLVSIQLSREDPGAARDTLRRLEQLATSSGSECAGAFAQLASGRVRAAEGDKRASGDLQAALQSFAALDLSLRGRAGPARARAGAGLGSARRGGRRGPDRAQDVRTPGRGTGRRCGGRAAQGTGDHGACVAQALRDAHQARDGGRATAGRGLLERRNRRAPIHQPENRGAPRREHPVQARPAKPRRGGRLRGTRATQRPVAE